jgi:hypothetical protein
VARNTALRFGLAICAVLAALVYGLAGRAATDVHSTARDNTSTTSETTPDVDAVYGRVAVVGDSLSAQAIVQEEAYLKAAGWGPVVVNALSGRRVPTDSDLPPSSGIAAVDEVRAAGPDPHTWIVELGTNDVWKVGADPFEFRRLIEAMLAKIGPGHEVIWTNVHNGAETQSSATFNAVLDQVASEHRNFSVANWEAVAGHGGFLLPDLTHLTGVGTVAFGALIAGTATLAAL